MATPTNAETARLLREIRTLMEFAGEPFFKFMAYERAAETLENAPPLGALLAESRLTELPGIGKTIAGRIETLARTGTEPYLEELRAKYPSTLLEVLSVPGVGMKTAQLFFERLGIASLADLERALDEGTLSTIPRLGAKSIENIRRGVLSNRGRARRTPLGTALPLAREIIAYLAQRTDAEDLTPAGSVRRQEPTVGDVDIICTSHNPEAVIAAFTGWDRAEAVLAEGPTKASIWLAGGLQIDLRVLPAHLYGNLLQHFTGSREHNIQFRELAVRKNLRVSENGIVDLSDGRTITSRDEADIYAAVGLPFIPPELRLGIGEIDAAREGTLPVLIEQSDVKGDFHMHCTWSDGRDSLDEMIAACAARGYEYHAISDHSLGRGAMGMTPEELRAQRAEVREIGARHGIRTLCAAEVDIRPDGTLDYDDEILAELDIVIASVHSAFNQSREEMTARLLRAIENPYVNIIGHPTGRNVETFPGYDFDHDAVFAAAARTGTALEIDGQPARLDLPSQLARRAKSFGVTFSTDSDAHGIGDLANVAYAVGQARRGWLTAADVLNARPLEGVLAFVAAKRSLAAT
ncbi:MAG TPA: DNA polymerase/3'-5' exonuclease PolX [Candidatus Limnocylindria bacterium]|jgi:DNA polymerase (family 10)|nr:DNA polymerase/3'-5' exonuclease PolX [Candidatus Limnocylindria bacterium]